MNFTFTIFMLIRQAIGESIKSIKLSAEKTVAIFHEVRRNSHSIAPNFVENIGSFGKLKII